MLKQLPIISKQKIADLIPKQDFKLEWFYSSVEYDKVRIDPVSLSAGVKKWDANKMHPNGISL